MSRETQTGRLTHPASASTLSTTSTTPPTSGGAGAAAPALLALLAGAPSLIDLLPRLHQYAIEMTGGGCSLLFEHNPRNGALQATSGNGLEELRTDPWLPGPDEAALVAQTFARRGATFVTDLDRQMPDLAARLGTPSARLLPLVYGDERIGLLAIGFRDAPSEN